MSRPITVRLPVGARSALDDIVDRTQRSIAWLLTEAIYDAGQACALDPTALEPYLVMPIGRDPKRTTFHLNDAAAAVLTAMPAAVNYRPAELARAAWLYWTSTHRVDEIAAFSGAVRPTAGGGAP